MVPTTEAIVQALIRNVSAMQEVLSVGISGGKEPLPRAGEGDIDIFIYCEEIPDVRQRSAAFDHLRDELAEVKLEVFAGGHWGVGDFALVNGVETWLMYFTLRETVCEVESILRGDYPDKLDNYYYPTGRCAMLKEMRIFYDRHDHLLSLQKRLAEYPEELAEILVRYHLEELADLEDLERAGRRGDLLFYHFALDLAIDHFLQALFAMNRTYFPSRKRTFGYMESFRLKPEGCRERLSEIVRLGGHAEGVGLSFALWCGLIDDLRQMEKNSR